MMRLHVYAVVCAAVLTVAGMASAREVSPMAGKQPVQAGSLANETLIKDAMMGVASKAVIMGCKQADAITPYVMALPEGEPGSRVWHERWVLQCQKKTYPVDIEFSEAGMNAANYVIR